MTSLKERLRVGGERVKDLVPPKEELDPYNFEGDLNVKAKKIVLPALALTSLLVVDGLVEGVDCSGGLGVLTLAVLAWELIQIASADKS